jgi:cytochrome c oxidase subunit IV
MSATKSNQGPGMKFYALIWVVLVVIATIEVLLTYQRFAAKELLPFLLLLAFLGVGIAVMYFMRLKYERRSLLWSLIPWVVFVLFMLNHIWPDALRLEHLRILRW